jgi:hypothetical protein
MFLLPRLFNAAAALTHGMDVVGVMACGTVVGHSGGFCSALQRCGGAALLLPLLAIVAQPGGSCVPKGPLRGTLHMWQQQ